MSDKSIVAAQYSAEFDEQDLQFEWLYGQVVLGMVPVILVDRNSAAQRKPSILSRQPRRSRDALGVRLPPVLVAEFLGATKPNNSLTWLLAFQSL